MRIVKQTSKVLKLEAKNHFLGRLFVLLFGTIFFVPGWVILILVGKLTTLKCHRLEPNQVPCEVIVSGLFGKEITSIPTGQLESATVEVRKLKDGLITYRIVLITKNKNIPFALSDSSEGEKYQKYKKVKQINNFLNNSEEMSLKIQEDERWSIYPLGGSLILMGGGIIYLSLMCKFTSSWIFDKRYGRMYLIKKNVFQSETRERRLDEIEEVKVIEEIYSRTTVYNLQLILHSREQIPIPIGGSPSHLFQLAESINLFLSR